MDQKRKKNPRYVLAKNGKIQKFAPNLYQIWIVKSDIQRSFLTQILQTHLHHTPEAAYQMLEEINDIGYSMCGIYTKEVAETKAYEIIKYANLCNQFVRLIVQKGVVNVIRKF